MQNIVNNDQSRIEKEISSAEMTATWRCDEPEFSHDNLSILLVSDAGINKARTYQHTQYPFASRHMSLRAGYFFEEIYTLLSTGNYDSLISIGSGLSLLTYCVAKKFAENHNRPLCIFDSDLEYMINARSQRLAQLKIAPLPSMDIYYAQTVLNIEAAHKHSLKTGKILSTFLPNSCTKPIFILEGITYFLSKACLKWLFSNIKSYTQSAIIFDYWPDDAPTRSIFFNNVLEYFKNNVPENVTCLLGSEDLVELTAGMKVIRDITINQIEAKMVTDKPHLLTDENTHIPVNICCLYNKRD